MWIAQAWTNYVISQTFSLSSWLWYLGIFGTACFLFGPKDDQPVAVRKETVEEDQRS